jgi:hypothetical protein
MNIKIRKEGKFCLENKAVLVQLTPITGRLPTGAIKTTPKQTTSPALHGADLRLI